MTETLGGARTKVQRYRAWVLFGTWFVYTAGWWVAAAEWAADAQYGAIPATVLLALGLVSEAGRAVRLRRGRRPLTRTSW